MATFVETKDVNIFIDPGVALGPLRYGLPPHELEEEELEKRWRLIKKYVKKSDVLIVSHYHYDHHNPDEPEIYKDKIVYIKHPTEHINKSQKKRAAFFIQQIQGYAKQIKYADSSSATFGKTKIIFSDPQPHGPSTRLGYVVETLVESEGRKFIHTSDVEGPALESQVEFIIKHKPQIVFLDGPLSYIMQRYGRKNLEASLENMKRIIDSGVKTLIFDHHFLRDKRYPKIIEPVVEYGKEKKARVITSAEFMGEKLRPLELMRKELYGR